MPDDATLVFGNALLCGLDGEVLVRSRHLLVASVEDDEVTDEVEQSALVAELGSTTNYSGVPIVP